METIKLLRFVYAYTRSFIFLSLSRDEKLRIGNYDEVLEKKIFDILMQEVANDIIDWKITREFANWFKTWLATRIWLTRQYKNMK